MTVSTPPAAPSSQPPLTPDQRLVLAQEAVRRAEQSHEAARKRARIDFDALKEEKGLKCSLVLRKLHPRRTEPDCSLDCTFDFREHLSELAQVVKGPTDRYRIKSLEGRYKLQAAFSLSRAQQHMDALSKPPVELIDFYTKESQHWEENRITFRNLLRTPPSQLQHLKSKLEMVRFVHLADRYQRPFLGAESILKRYFTPLCNLLAATPARWQDGSIQEKWQKDIARVWTNVTSGQLFDKIGKALVNGPGAIVSHVVERTRSQDESKKA